MTDDSAPSAHADIRRAEAERMLGTLDAATLPDRAAGWRSRGVDTANVRALAQSAAASVGVRLALLAEVARELGLGFATVAQARAAHAEQIIRSTVAGDVTAGFQLFALSNSVTDGVAARGRSLLRRLFRRSARDL